MFLATTALREFWDTEREILFLGSWCTRYDRKADWKDLSFQVMPSPWDDRTAFHNACCYLEQCYDRLLGQLSEYLNAVHKVSFEQRYWRITVGPWLLWYLHASYDRYVHLVRALEMYTGLETLCLEPASFRTPHDMPEFAEAFVDDSFNLQLFSQILTGIGLNFPTRTPELIDSQTSWPFRRTLKSKLKGWVGRSANRAMNTIRSSDVGLADMQLSSSIRLELALKSRLKTMPIECEYRRDCPDVAPLAAARAGFCNIPVDCEFERIFVLTLATQFPSHYLECFSRIREQVARRIKDLPKVIVSSGDWKFNEYFKFAAAEAVGKNRRLIACQHGGGYGLLRFSPTEREEIAVADEYFAWGWANGESDRLKNLPSPALSKLKARHADSQSRKSLDHVALVTTDHPRYLYFFHSVPVGTQWEDYAEWQARFIRALPQSLQSVLMYRPYVVDYGHGFSSRVRDAFPQVRIDRSIPIQRVLAHSRVLVIDHPMTTILEAVALNVPTLMFWNDRLWEMRPQAATPIDKLRNAQILWHSPEQAAEKLAEIYEDPWSWWGSQIVQDARREFVDRYAYADPNWAESWAHALSDALAGIQREN